MKTLQTVVNPATKSTFYTIAQHESGIIGSLRIFLEKSPNKAHTIIAFRFRVEPVPTTGTVPANVPHYLAVTFPQANWSSKSSTHCSLAGAMAVDRPVWNVEEVLGTLAKTFSFPLLFDRLGYEFPQFTWELTKEEFTEFCTDQITQLLTKGAVDSSSVVPGVVFQFGQYQKLLAQTDGTVQAQNPDVPYIPEAAPDFAVLTPEPENMAAYQATVDAIDPMGTDIPLKDKLEILATMEPGSEAQMAGTKKAQEYGQSKIKEVLNGKVEALNSSVQGGNADIIALTTDSVQLTAPDAPDLTPAQKAVKAMGIKGFKKVGGAALEAKQKADELAAANPLLEGDQEDSSSITKHDVGL
jgi:hypothetical protein